MPASEMRSSARVAPRSVSRETAVSAITSDTVPGQRLDAAGARDIADGAEAHGLLDDLFVLARLQVLVHGQQHPVALENLALVRVVDRRQFDLLGPDVGPDVELGPVGQREHPDVLTLVVAAVVQVPQLRPLRLGVPLAELVAEAEHPLLGAGLLLVAAGTAERGVELVLPDGAQQRDGLQRVARRDGLDHAAGVDVVLHLGDDQPHTGFGDELVADLDDLVEVVAGVDVHHRERQPARPERLERQMQHHDGVLAAGEQQHRPLELRGHLPNDVDGLGLQRAQMAQLVAACLVELLGGGHRFPVKLVEITRFICITRYGTRPGLQCQSTNQREQSQKSPSRGVSGNLCVCSSGQPLPER